MATNASTTIGMGVKKFLDERGEWIVGIIILAAWLGGSFYLSDLFEAHWITNPTVTTSQTVWLPEKYQVVKSLKDVSCLDKDCVFEVKRLDVSENAFKQLLPHFKQVFVSLESGSISYLGKENQQDLGAFFFRVTKVSSSWIYSSPEGKLQGNQAVFTSERNSWATGFLVFFTVVLWGVVILLGLWIVSKLLQEKKH